MTETHNDNNGDAHTFGETYTGPGRGESPMKRHVEPPPNYAMPYEGHEVEAVAEGELVDASDIARAMGWLTPVYVTRELHDVLAVSELGWRDNLYGITGAAAVMVQMAGGDGTNKMELHSKDGTSVVMLCSVPDVHKGDGLRVTIMLASQFTGETL